ncbi:MAG: ParA family protein [Planctomycetes bacterium]|nr:ParA family protein [Planctomycetota bacterium]
MHTIALVNQKGGVGKSTTAVNLSAGLALLGRRVLLIDLDPQAHSTVALGLQPKKLGASIYSLLSGAATVKDVIKPVSPGLSIIPSTINLAGGEAELTWQQNPHFILKKAMAELGESEYDYAIVDSPPQLGFLNVNSLAWVKHVFIPLTCEFYALHCLSLLVETVERIKAKLNPELAISGVITCQFNPRRALTKDVIADLENHFPGKVLKSRIRVNVRLAEAPSHGMSVHQYAPGSNGSKDYLSLAKELIEVLPAAASPEVEAQLVAIARAEAEAKGKAWSESAEPVTPTWSAPVETPVEAEAAPAAEAAAPVEAPAEPVVAEAPAAPAEAVAETKAPVDPLADLMAPVAEAAPAPAVEAPPAPVEMEMPQPADEGRVYEPTSPMIASAAEVSAMAPPAETEPAPAAAAEVDDNATRLGFDPYAESSAHLETESAAAPAPEAEAKPEFVSPLPATPVQELRAAIASDAPTTPAPESTVKPVPALPSVKAASLPFNDRIAMAGLKPIVTSRPGERPPLPEKKGLFGKFWKR